VPVQYSYTSTPPMGRTVCTDPQCPVQYSYTSTPLSTCTVQLYLYSPYGPYSLYRPSVPVQYSYTSTPLSTCTVKLYLYSPYGPYGLYRASVPVQGCTSSTYCRIRAASPEEFLITFMAECFMSDNGKTITLHTLALTELNTVSSSN